jgi:hypothetical protein
MQFGRNDPNILKPIVLQWLSGFIDRMAGQSWRRHPLHTIIRAVRRDCLGLKQSRGEVDDLGTTAGTVVSGHEMATDQQREGKHAPGLDVVLVEAELPKSSRRYSMHRLSTRRKRLPRVLAEAKSYAERLFAFERIEHLSEDLARKAPNRASRDRGRRVGR